MKDGYCSEPGIGKSRITENFLAGLEGELHTRLRYFCSPHHTQSALYPFIAQIERAAGFGSEDGTETKLDRLEILLKPTARNVQQDVSLFAELLGIPREGRYGVLDVSPQKKREITFNALLDRLVGLAALKPLLVVFEDAHWIDPTSIDLLDRTIARITDLPVLLIITFRPEFQPTWVGQPHVTMLPLSRLNRRDVAAIIMGVTKGNALSLAQFHWFTKAIWGQYSMSYAYGLNTRQFIKMLRRFSSAFIDGASTACEFEEDEPKRNLSQ